MSFFPSWPSKTTDNRQHLQALRHFYVLAVDWRGASAIDVESGSEVLAVVDVTARLPPAIADPRGRGDALPAHLFEDADGLVTVRTRKVLPCLLPPAESVVAIDVVGPRYWPQALPGNAGLGEGPCTGRRLYVQRRKGYLPYEEDPKGLRSPLCRPPVPVAPALARPRGPRRDEDGWCEAAIAAAGAAGRLSALGADGDVRAFVQATCQGAGPRDSFLSAAAAHGLRLGEQAGAFIYYELWRIAKAAGEGHLNTDDVEQVRLLAAYARARPLTGAPAEGGGDDGDGDGDGEPLPEVVQEDTIVSCRNHIAAALARKGPGPLAATAEYVRTRQFPADPAAADNLRLTIAQWGLPGMERLELLAKAQHDAGSRGMAAWLAVARQQLPDTPAAVLLRLAGA